MNHSGSFVVQRSAEDVYGLLADPQSFAPLLPDYESMEMQDATHFQLRTVLEVGQIRGHANLAMVLRECVHPGHVKYEGEGMIAGSRLRFGVEFAISASPDALEVRWNGEVSVEGMLEFLAGNLIESKGRADFEQMAESVRMHLTEVQVPQAAPAEQAAPAPQGNSDEPA